MRAEPNFDRPNCPPNASRMAGGASQKTEAGRSTKQPQHTTTKTMKRLINLPALLLAASLAWSVFGTTALHAQADAAAPPAAAAPAADAKKPEPTLEQRVAGLEAYLNNADPTAPLKTGPKDKDGNPTIPDGLTTPVVGISGAGHNGWMMTSSALVLFMTLPGLALFYGGLVRKKNVLSVWPRGQPLKQIGPRAAVLAEFPAIGAITRRLERTAQPQ